MNSSRIESRIARCWPAALAVGVIVFAHTVFAQGLLPPVPTPATAHSLPPLPGPDSTATPVAILLDTPYLGAQSCASSSCHGSTQGGDQLRAAYIQFQENDPHTRAGEVLFSEKSQAIATRLKLAEPAWRSNVCLVCHAPGAVDMQDDARVKTLVSDGVSCESCHGAAREWLGPHRSLEWKDPVIWPAARKMETGFQLMKSLTVRAKRCADCHIGSVNGQVDHDLIAAGHPRLLFEFSGDQDRLPAHWKRSIDRIRLQAEAGSSHTSFEATAWLLGQLVAADREFELVKHAASNPLRPWPELSQYDCYSCHQDLKIDQYRYAGGTAGTAGKMKWGTWNLGLLRTTPQLFLTGDLVQFQNDSADFNRLMQSFTDDREKVIQLANAQQLHLKHELSQRPAQLIANRNVEMLRNELLNQNREMSLQGWDTSTQFYLAIVALQLGVDETEGRSAITDPNLVAILQEIRSQLAFRKKSPTALMNQYDSPKGFGRPERVNLSELFLRYQTEVAGSPSALFIPAERK